MAEILEFSSDVYFPLLCKYVDIYHPFYFDLLTSPAVPYPYVIAEVSPGVQVPLAGKR